MGKDKMYPLYCNDGGKWVLYVFETNEDRDAFREFRKKEFPKGGFVNNATEKIVNPKNTVTIGPNDEPKTRKNRLHSRRKYLTSKLRKINSQFIKTRIDD